MNFVRVHDSFVLCSAVYGSSTQLSKPWRIDSLWRCPNCS